MLNKLISKLGMRKEELRILIPKELDKEDYIGGVRDFHKEKTTFKRGEITAEIYGKRVRYWKQVWKAEVREEDKFVPIFWKVAEKKVRKDKDLMDFS